MSDTKVDRAPVQEEEARVEDEMVQDRSRSLEGQRDMRLMVLLRELTEKHGGQKTAELLGVSYRSLSRAFEAGRPHRLLRDALERHLLMGGGAAAAKQREQVQTLEQRVESLEVDKRDAGSIVEGLLERMREDLQGLREGLEEHANAIRQLERRLAGLEAQRGLEAERHQVASRPAAVPARRVYRELVTLEPEAGEERVYGDATPLVVEWRRARSEFLAAEDKVTKLRAEERLRALEIAMIGEHGMTLPPATHPWDRLQRRDELQRRILAQEEGSWERARAQWFRRLRRVLTFGLWRTLV